MGAGGGERAYASVLDIEAFHTVLAAGLKHGASDIHFRPGTTAKRRVNSRLSTSTRQPRALGGRRARGGVNGDGHITCVGCVWLQEAAVVYSLAGVTRYRANIYRQRGSLALVMRII